MQTDFVALRKCAHLDYVVDVPVLRVACSQQVWLVHNNQLTGKLGAEATSMHVLPLMARLTCFRLALRVCGSTGTRRRVMPK